jgi:hypothetical protein
MYSVPPNSISRPAVSALPPRRLDDALNRRP